MERLDDFISAKATERSVPKGEERHAFLVRLTDTLRELADPVAIQAEAVHVLGEYLGAARAFYGEIAPDGDEMAILRDYTAEGVPSMVGRYRISDFGPFLLNEYRAGRTVVMPNGPADLRLSETERAAYAAIAVRAFVCVPLIKDGRLVSVLAVNQCAPRSWTSMEVSLIEETAERTWAAVERAKAEAKLREVKEHYLALFNAIDQGFCTIEVAYDENDKPADYRFLEVSPSFERQTGISNAAGRWMREIAPDQDEHWFEIYGRVARTGEPERFESYSTPLGRWWYVYAFRVQDPALRRIGVLFYDITERKLAEAALRESEERFRSVSESGVVAIAFFEPRGAIIDANDAFLDLVGYTRAELDAGAVRWDRLTPPEWMPRTREALEQYERTGRIEPYEKEYFRKSGERFWGLFGGRRIESTGEGVAFILDITARKQMEQALKDANRRKDEFLAMLGHELRNPLAPIRNGLDVLSMEAGTSSRKTIQLLQQQVEHLARLVDDLLDVSRITRGKIELRKQRVRLSDLVRRSVRAVSGMVQARQQELHVSLPEEPVWIDADPVRLVQVIDNLLTNAAKYNEAGGHVELTVEVREGQAIIVVRDTGIGVEPELLPNVFELFTQSSRSLQRAEGGLGIGLSLVKQLVEMHEGTVSAESPGVGQGSTFIVRLPAVEAPLEAPEEVVRRAVANSCRVLVVDDNVPAAEMLAALLSKLGEHRVETAHDGRSALESIRQACPEVVFLDIGLPGMDGYQVATEIRRAPEFDDLLLVALTGYGQKSDRQRSQEAGFDEHLVKPPSAEQIQAVFAHPKLLREGHREQRAAIVLQGPHPPPVARPMGQQDDLAPAGSPPSSGEADLRQIKHDIKNTTYALKMAVQMLSDPNPDADVIMKVVKGLHHEANALDKLAASLPGAVDGSST